MFHISTALYKHNNDNATEIQNNLFSLILFIKYIITWPEAILKYEQTKKNPCLLIESEPKLNFKVFNSIDVNIHICFNLRHFETCEETNFQLVFVWFCHTVHRLQEVDWKLSESDISLVSKIVKTKS
jgi:hypothetical protein